MSGTPVALGPWTGGMKNVSEEATVANDELSLVENMEQDIDGSLVSRPAITLDDPGPTGIGTITSIEPLGYYVPDTGITYLVCTINDTATYLYAVATKVWTEIWDEPASGFTQYSNKAVLISTSVAGGYWEAGVWTDTPSMPLGEQIVFYQERFWAYGARGTTDSTTVWFSKLTVISPPSSIFDWDTSTDFFTVSEGDGEWITALVPDTNALLIFRNGSTFVFTYPNSPINGTLRTLSKTIGCENKWAVAPYESYYLVFSAGFMYQFINFRYYPVNVKKIEFRRTTLANPLVFDVRLSIFGRRAILWFFGAVYVYKLVTSTWSMWVSPSTRAGHFFTIPPSSVSGESRVALAVTGEDEPSLRAGLYRVEESVLGTGEGELMTCRVRTKAYDFEEAAQYKRLFYWTVEIRSSEGIEALAHPDALPDGGTTWNEMEDYNWNDFGTWNNPLVLPVEYVDDVEFPTMAPVRTLVKIRGSHRFRRDLFEVIGVTRGTAATGPFRIYQITPYLQIEANVSRKVS
jgi:hypothetical protein